MRRLVLAVCWLAAVPATASAAPLNELPFAARPGIATCLRATGAPGELVVYGANGAELRSAGDDGAQLVTEAPLGRLVECAAVATAPGGAAVIAGAVRPRAVEVRARVRDPGGAFGGPVRLGPGSLFASSVAAAVSPAGHAVVGWAQVRGRLDPRRPARYRIVAARRAPGGAFGPVEALTAWRRGPGFAPSAVKVGIDAAGVATIVWARPLFAEMFDEDHDIGVASAAPGARFASQMLAERVDDITRPALSVAPDGWTLLAYDGSRGVRAYERAPGAGEFTQVLAAEAPSGGDPAVAVRDGGGGLVAWRSDRYAPTGVEATVRSGPGPFGPAQTLEPEARDFSSGGLIAIATSGGPPYDPEAGALRAALAADGRALLAWPSDRPLAGGASTPRLAAGSLGGGFARPVELGSPVRDASGVAPLFLPDGRAALAWVDNAGHYEASLPNGPGRLHLAIESAAELPEPPAPRVTLRARPTQRLYASQPVRVTASCAQACDLRAIATVPRSSTLAVARTLRGGRRSRLRFELLERERRGSVRFVARATAPGGRAVGRASARVRVIERPPLPVPPVLDLSTRRRGGAIVVTWRTASPARRTVYFVEGRRRRGGTVDVTDRGTYAVARGRARTTFTVRLRPRRPGRVRWVAVTASSFDGPQLDPVIVEVS